MIKKLLYLSPLLLFTSAALDINSNSAPASSTGAPGETDCTTSGCHQSFVVNSGPGSTSINFENGVTNYTPGKTYIITTEVDQANLTRFGFQMVALKDKDQKNAGTFTVQDGSRNQIISGYGNLADRKYMTYTFKSTNSLTTGKGTWSFNWTAPATDEGSISFYLASIAANNDGNDLGDYCYAKKTTLTPAISQTKNPFFSLNIFPNPVKEKININYNITETSDIKIDLVDLQGKIVEELFSAKQNSDEYQLTLPLTKAYKGGIYFVRFAQNNKISLKKIFITN